MSYVYIVTNVEHGWDCIVGVFEPEYVSKEELEQRFTNEEGYCIFQRIVESNLRGY